MRRPTAREERLRKMEQTAKAIGESAGKHINRTRLGLSLSQSCPLIVGKRQRAVGAEH